MEQLLYGLLFGPVNKNLSTLVANATLLDFNDSLNKDM